MELISKKELTPVIYGEMGIKVLPPFYFKPGSSCFENHWHERMELLRVTEGSIDFYRNDFYCEIKSGEMAIICPKQLHNATAGKSGVKYDVVMFDIEKLNNDVISTQKYLRPLIEQKALLAPKTDKKDIISIVDDIIKLVSNNKSKNPLWCLGLIYTLLGGLYDECLIEKEEYKLFDKKFDVVINYIHENYTDNISCALVSRKFNFDEAYFCRKFKRITGTTLMKYIKKLRLDKARKMLEEADTNISFVSVSCGFSNTAYFSRCFKSEFQITPTQYMMDLEQEEAAKRS